MFEVLRPVVRSVVTEADPVHLLELGASEDEYGPEIDEIVRKIIHHGPISDGIEIVLLIQEVFDRWFYPGQVSWEQCLAMARSIHNELKVHERRGSERDETADGDAP